MERSMDWLYFHYILPVLQEEPRGEYAKNFENLEQILDIPHTIDFEIAMEFYAVCAFRLGLRTGVSLRQLLADD